MEVQKGLYYISRAQSGLYYFVWGERGEGTQGNYYCVGAQRWTLLVWSTKKALFLVMGIIGELLLCEGTVTLWSISTLWDTKGGPVTMKRH